MATNQASAANYLRPSGGPDRLTTSTGPAHWSCWARPTSPQRLPVSRPDRHYPDTGAPAISAGWKR